MQLENGLYPHGIMNEQSTLRAHVCPKPGEVYIFSTEEARKIIVGMSDYTLAQREKLTHIRGVLCRRSITIRLEELTSLRIVPAAAEIAAAGGFHDRMSPSEFGNTAVDVVKMLIEAGKFPFPAHPEVIPVGDKRQIEGYDLVVRAEHRIEVKYNHWGGRPPGMGDLLIQTHERNLYGYH